MNPRPPRSKLTDTLFPYTTLFRSLRGHAGETLLASNSHERVHATRQNLDYGAKSTEFMAPPDYGFRLLRAATLRLSLADPAVRSLLNPRQSAPSSYQGRQAELRVGEECVMTFQMRRSPDH